METRVSWGATGWCLTLEGTSTVSLWPWPIGPELSSSSSSVPTQSTTKSMQLPLKWSKSVNRPLRPISTKQQYEAALREIEPFFGKELEPDTPEAYYFEILAMLIEDYEEKRWPIDAPDPVEAIKYRM